MNQLETVTSKIGNEYEKWNNDMVVFIEAGTGKGKTHFIKNTLYEYAKENDKKILLLSNRTSLLNQNIYELAQDDKLTEGVIVCYNYQKIDYQESHIKDKSKDEYIDLKSYDYIICDECHYFFTDSVFNKFTDISLKWILDSKAIKIFMSATPRICKKYISNKVGSNNIINYKLNTDYSYIEKLYFYRDERVIEDNLLDNIAKGEKVIYFNHSAIECYRLSEKYNNSMFLCGKDNKLYRYVNKELVENMLQNEKFDTQMLFTTQCMDNGVNIKDRQIKHIVIDIKDFDTLIQCLGRKRVLDENDTVAVYVKNVSKEQLGGDVTGGKNKLAIADELSWITTKQWIMKYPRENTDTGIVYYGKDKELHVNYIAYVKYEDKVKFAEVLLKYANDSKNYVDKKYPYACTVSTNLGRKWKMYDNEHSIKTFEEYLESMVGIRLFKDDGQQQLKEQFEVYGLKVKNDRNMGLNTMNGFLADMELLYEIISKKVKVDGKLLTAWIITDLPN